MLPLWNPFTVIIVRLTDRGAHHGANITVRVRPRTEGTEMRRVNPARCADQVLPGGWNRCASPLAQRRWRSG